MEFGASIFFTDYSISPADLAIALEERGFESLWVAEHSHIPVPRRTPAPGGGELPKRYYDVMDPFVTLSVAAAVTKRLKLGTGGGWNAEEIENHGAEFATRFIKMREQIESMKEIWTKETAEYHGDIISFTAMQTGPKPVQQPHPPVILGGAFPWAARRAIRYGDGWIPIAGTGRADPLDYLPRFRQMAEEAGRDPRSLPVTLGGAPEDADLLQRYRDLGVVRANFPVPPARADEILPRLDRLADLMRQLK